MTKEIAKQESKALTTSTMDLSSYEGAGFESVNQNDTKIPLLKIVQSMSDAVDAFKASPGQFFNNVTNELYDEIEVYVVQYYSSFIKYESNGAKKQYRGEYLAHELPKEAVLEDSFRQIYRLDENTTLEDSKQWMVIFKDVDADDTKWAVGKLSLTSTQIKSSKNWLTQVTTLRMNMNGSSKRAPIFFGKYLLTTNTVKNDKGSWRQLAFKLVGNVLEVPEEVGSLITGTYDYLSAGNTYATELEDESPEVSDVQATKVEQNHDSEFQLHA